MSYDTSFPTEPIGGKNPYYRCASCKKSVPEINGELENHYEWCGYRKGVELKRFSVSLSEVDNLRAEVYKLYTNWQSLDSDYGVDYAEAISQALTVIDKFIREHKK